MPTRPGMMVWPCRSMSCALELVGASLEMLVILPFSMRRYWSSRGAAPVPSMMRTWVRRTAGALTLAYLATAGESGVVWAWRVVRDRARIAMGAERGCMSFSGGVSLPETGLRLWINPRHRCSPMCRSLGARRTGNDKYAGWLAKGVGREADFSALLLTSA